MEEILIAALQFLFEFFFEVFASVVFDRPSKTRNTPESEPVAWAGAYWFIGGCALGAVSLVVYSHSLINLAELRTLNLVSAPLTSGFLSQTLAERLAKRNPNIFPRIHFWKSFWFTLGLVLLRFAYASHA